LHFRYEEDLRHNLLYRRTNRSGARPPSTFKQSHRDPMPTAHLHISSLNFFKRGRMNNQEIIVKLERAIRNERRATNEILELINLATDRKIHLEQAYPSMFEWLVRGYGFSESSAYRRIEAARMIQAVPETADKLATGQLNITTLTVASSIFRLHEKATKKKISKNEKADALLAIQKKSRREAERILISRFPEASPGIKKETTKTVDENTSRLSLNLSEEVMKDLSRIRDLLAAIYPDATYAQIIGRIAKEYLDRKDPLRKVVKPRFRRQASNHRPDLHQ